MTRVFERKSASREPLGTALGRSDGHRVSGQRASSETDVRGEREIRSGRDAPWASSHAMVSATTRGTPPHPSLHASRRGAPNTGIVGGSDGVRQGTVRARASVPNRVRREKRFGGKTGRSYLSFIRPSASISAEELLSFRQRWLRAARASPRAPPRSAPSCSTGTGLGASPVARAPPPTTRRPPSRSTWCCIATRVFSGRTRLATTTRLRRTSPREAARRAAWAR